MMSSSSKFHYDVFVSFRGKDTRHTFIDHLFAALQRKCIFAFRDDSHLNKDESVPPTYRRVIENSQICIVVFSENYASSTWCLQELEYILYCVQLNKKLVLPVFYDVDPSDVRNQQGSYGEAFAKHERRFDSDKIQQWRAAMTLVANHSGWDVRDKPQSLVIEKIVKEIIKIMGFNSKVSSVPNDLVGMDSPIEELEKYLLLDSFDNVRVVGICGMGGIGKTTLATVLYNKISHQFGACCFINDVSKIYKREGLIGVHKQILHQTLGGEHLQIYNLHDADKLKRSRLCRLRALIILDNVEQIEPFDTLVFNREWLGAGSRIIMISRIEYIFAVYGVSVVYRVPLLNQINSLQLFCQTFSNYDLNLSSSKELVHDVLNYANGLPLAIKVLSSFLSRVDISEWKTALPRFIVSPKSDIMNVLQLSIDRLEEMEKEVFLDIACFFNGCEEDYVKNVLKYCGFDADFGLSVLVKKSLISISDENKIEMHALLEELGRNIRKWSRLWLHEQFYNVVLENMENNVEAVVLYGSERKKGILMGEALSKMNRLRLLILNEVKFSGSLDSLSNNLRYVAWNEYPFLCLPSSFQPNHLVELILVDSNIKQLWEGKKNLPNLRTLDLSYSENLLKMPYFGDCPILERLNLEGCVKLMLIDPSIGLLRELVFLNLKNCENLICIPYEIPDLTSLKYLNLCGCSKAYNNPKAPEDFASILLPSLPRFSSFLSELDISFCGLSQIPDALGCVPCLERLNLRGNNFVTLPSLRELSKLEYLNLEHCKQLKSLTELPSPTAIKQDKYKRAGMYIFNCPEFGDREHCSSMAFSWMMHFIQAKKDSSASFHQIDIVIPGSEIPKWFNNRRMGRSIIIDPSPIVYDDNIIGIACCVVFSLEPFDLTTTRYDWGPAIQLGFKSSNAADSHYVVIPVTLYRYLIRVKSNHMWLIYFDRELFFSFMSSIDNTLWDLDHIKMEASVTNGQGLLLEVKNCGYRWVFKQNP